MVESARVIRALFCMLRFTSKVFCLLLFAAAYYRSLRTGTYTSHYIVTYLFKYLVLLLNQRLFIGVNAHMTSYTYYQSASHSCHNIFNIAVLNCSTPISKVWHCCIAIRNKDSTTLSDAHTVFALIIKA